MKKNALVFLSSLCLMAGNAQNVGIGTAEPQNRLHVEGNLLVNTVTMGTNTPPTVAQTRTIINGTTISFLNSDSTGRIYDPGGLAGNYNANLLGYASIQSLFASVGIVITIESMQLGTGDSLIIKENSSAADNLMAVGNGYTATGKWVFNATSLYIIFKSNADANTGSGFSILFRRLHDNTSSLTDIEGITGKALFFDTKNGSFRSGLIDNSTRGIYSTAMGQVTTASGNSSTAMGQVTTASGNSSTAMGQVTNASGYASTAMGQGTTASGNTSTAMGAGAIGSGNISTAMGQATTASGPVSTSMGYFTTASGVVSTAMGSFTTASGDYSMAIGNYVSTNGLEGTLVIGDKSTTTVMNSSLLNSFRARFANGYRFYTSSDYSTSCVLSGGSNAWSTTSDVRTKENLAEVDGEEVLKKIAGFHLTTWNYKKQDPARFRHYGPMAQDFYAAFGKDKYGSIGNDTTINSADMAGVSFIAIQALEKRTAMQQQQQEETIVALQKEIEELKLAIRQQQKVISGLLSKDAGKQ